MKIQQNVPLAPLTTLRLGGPARFFARAETVDDLREALTFAHSQSLPIFCLGGGSNLVVPDHGYAGLVLQVALEGPTHILGVSHQTPAGTDWDTFVLETCKSGISGIESLAGIPGLVGGAPVQNIGAYGQEVAQTIEEVHVLDTQNLQQEILSSAECHFSYRSSIFNSTHRNQFLVTAVRFHFDLERAPTLAYADLKKHFLGHPPPTPLEIYHAVREIRSRKGMLLVEGDPDCRSAGSFFKNPVVPVSTLARIAETLSIPLDRIPNWPVANHTLEQNDPAGPTAEQGTSPTQNPGQTKLPAAWLIEQAGFPKGYTLGNAGISSRHTLALINRTGSATAAGLYALRDQITTRVQQLFGVDLHQEPVELA